MNGEIFQGNCCAYCKPFINEAKGFFRRQDSPLLWYNSGLIVHNEIVNESHSGGSCLISALISLFFQFQLQQQKRMYKLGPAGFVRIVSSISIRSILGSVRFGGTMLDNGSVCNATLDREKCLS